MGDSQRFRELLEAIAADVREETRKRLPVLDTRDAAILARGLHIEVVKHEVARERYASAENQTIACRLGCTFCCENVVVVYGPEAVAVAEWIERPENASEKQQFLDAYPAWRQTLAGDLDRFHDLHAHGDREAAEAFYRSLRRYRLLCALNHEGACLVYPARPSVCRYTMALDTSEYCEHGNRAGRGPTFLGFPPLDELMKRVLALLRVGHDRMENPGTPSSLCHGLHGLLTAEE